jgi:hypothetical protein
LTPDVNNRGYRWLEMRETRGHLLTGRLRAALVTVTATAVLGVAVPAASARLPLPYRESATRVAAGIERITYTRPAPAQTINVARISKDAPYMLRAVPAMGGFGDGLERTSSICRRVGCTIAVNGDFWKPGTDQPIGGVVSLGHLLRTPVSDHLQVSLGPDGGLHAGRLELRASLVPDDLAPLSVTGINRKPQGNELVIYTPAYGRATGTKKGTLELPLSAIRPTGAVVLSRTTLVRVGKNGSTSGNAPIPREGAVLAGRGRGDTALRDLLRRVRSGATAPNALLRLDSNHNAVESIGGSHMLVRNGLPTPPSEPTSFVIGRHPRTLLGWTSKGDVLLVTVDGRQAGRAEGMTLAEAARMMTRLGATDAINLDGGGSTTFVQKGLVLNRPSDRAVNNGRGTAIVQTPRPGERSLGNVERPVAIALAVVPKSPTVAAANAVAMKSLELPEPVDAPAPQSSDPASVLPIQQAVALPAIVPGTAAGNEALKLAAILLGALAVALTAGSWGYRHGRRRAHQTWIRRLNGRASRPTAPAR